MTYLQAFKLLILKDDRYKSRVWIDVRLTENDSTRLYKKWRYPLLSVASSNLVGRKSKFYFIIKSSLLLSIKPCWREIRPNAGKTTENEFVASFHDTTTQRSGFGQTSCVADEQAFVFGSCAFNKHSVLKIFMINDLNFHCVNYKLVT